MSENYSKILAADRMSENFCEGEVQKCLKMIYLGRGFDELFRFSKFVFFCSDILVYWHHGNLLTFFGPSFFDFFSQKSIFMTSNFLKTSPFLKPKYVSYHFLKLLVFLLSSNICSSLVIYILNLYVNILEINIAVNGLSKLNTCDCFAFKQFWVDCIIHKFNILQSSITLNSTPLNPHQKNSDRKFYRFIPPIHGLGPTLFIMSSTR